ncbi:12874_t:CDS:2, partial [Entrophospora sp. SA101]
MFYIDGTLVIYMIKPINETCFEPKFYIRVIYANGTVETSTQIYPIPEFNFCKIKTIDGNRVTLMIIKLLPKYGLLVYTNSTNVNSSVTYGILLSINGEFIRNENGEITKLKTGTIVQAPLKDGNYLLVICFQALNNGFGIVIANTTITKNNNSTKIDKPNQPSTSIYVSLIYPNEIVEQFLIYQSADVNLKIEMMRCGTGYTIIGYRCALKLSKIENYWMRILFSSNGAVKSVEPLEFDQFQNSLLLIPNPLYYGGFLVSSISQSETYKNKSTITVYLLDDDLKINSTLDLPNNLTISSFLPEHLNFGMLLHNNTFVAIIPNENDNKNWQLISTE